MDISCLVVRRIVAINRVNRMTGVYSVQNRPLCALCYKIRGHSVYTQNGVKYISDGEHMVFVPQGACYQFNCQERGECVILEFEAEGPGNQLSTFAIHNKNETLSLLDKIERAHTFRKPGHSAYCLSGLYKLFFYMSAHNESAYADTIKKRKIKAGLDYMESHYSESALSSRRLAEISGISEVYFRRLFTEIYDMTPKKYLSLIRLAKAKDLLLTREIPVQQIAAEIGFHDVYSFCKAFRKLNDCTPTEYRKRHWG